MSINPVLSTAISGLLAAAKRVDTAAVNIVNADTPGYRAAEVQQTTFVPSGGGVDGGTLVDAQLRVGDGPTDLATELVNMRSAEAAYAASAAIIRTAEEMSDEINNIRR